jgi:hypothetical protein
MISFFGHGTSNLSRSPSGDMEFQEVPRDRHAEGFFFGDGLKLVETTQMIDGISPMLATVYNWLVVWNMTFMTFHMLGMSSSQLTNSYFSEG